MIYYHCFVDGDPKLKISHSWNCCDYFVGGGFKPKILSHSWETKLFSVEAALVLHACVPVIL